MLVQSHSAALDNLSLTNKKPISRQENLLKSNVKLLSGPSRDEIHFGASAKADDNSEPQAEPAVTQVDNAYAVVEEAIAEAKVAQDPIQATKDALAALSRSEEKLIALRIKQNGRKTLDAERKEDLERKQDDLEEDALAIDETVKKFQQEGKETLANAALELRGEALEELEIIVETIRRIDKRAQVRSHVLNNVKDGLSAINRIRAALREDLEDLSTSDDLAESVDENTNIAKVDNDRKDRVNASNQNTHHRISSSTKGDPDKELARRTARLAKHEIAMQRLRKKLRSGEG